jgi:hypothetical protein
VTLTSYQVLESGDAYDDQSDLTQLFLPLPNDEQITRWRRNQTELSVSGLQSLVKEEHALLLAAREF